jgi:hypothetical protein
MKNINNLANSPDHPIYFAKHEVLNDEFAKNARLEALHKASSLGNEQYEVRIFFINDEEEEESLDTIIMMSDADYVEVLGGMDIPVRCILRVE